MTLPSGYYEVDWIQASYTQYIDTGFVPDSDTSVEVKGAYISASNSIYGTNPYSVFTTSTDVIRFRLNNVMYDVSESATTVRIYKFDKNLAYLDGTLVNTFASSTWSATYSALLFARHSASGTVEELCSAKIYYCKIWDNGTLVREFIPCVRTSDTVVGMYDTVNDVFYTNAGTGVFTPSEYPVIEYSYTRLQYIGCTGGSQYINTGVAYDSTKTITIDATLQDTVSYTSSSTVILGFSSSSGTWAGAYGSVYSCGGGVHSTVTRTQKAVLTASWYNGTESFSVDGTSVGTRAVTAPSTTLRIGSSQSGFPTSAYIYGAVVTVDGVQTLNLVPVRQNETQTLGMLDTLTNTFYPSAGTGTFIAGPVVNRIATKVSSGWKDVHEIFTKVNGNWKWVGKVYTKVDGSWYICYNNDVPTYTITTSAGSGGTITASQTVNYGADCTITITPASGCTIDYVVVDGVRVGAVSTYTFQNITANHTVSASFSD